MFATKKFVPLLALLALSCGEHSFDNSGYLSSVTFFNNSPYHISIYSTSFSGPILVDKLTPGKSYNTTLSPSSNYGVGSVFSIEYWYLVANYGECSCGDVWTSSIDPDTQILRNIESGKNYVIEIPEPTEKFEFKEAFFKILNISDKPFKLRYLKNTSLRQAGNGELNVPKGKVGVYKIDGEKEIKGYSIIQDNESPLPEFTTKNNYIYDFEFDGDTVKIIGEQKITF